MAGTSGSASIRLALDTASARTLPALICGIAPVLASKPASMRCAMRSGMK